MIQGGAATHMFVNSRRQNGHNSLELFGPPPRLFPLKVILKKSSNKLRMKALVGWNTLFQVSELINLLVFFTRIKNEIHKEDKIVFKV